MESYTLLRLHSGLFRDWQRTHTQSSVTAAKARDSEWMSGSAKAGTTAARHTCELGIWFIRFARSFEARVGRSVFSLDFRLRRKSHFDLDRALNGSDLHGVAEMSELPNQGALALLNRVQITAARTMLDIANLLMEDLPDEPE